MFSMLKESLDGVDAFIEATNLHKASMEAVEEQLFVIKLPFLETIPEESYRGSHY